MGKTAIGVLVLVFLAAGIPSYAQNQNPLVGTWEFVSETIDGKEVPQSLEGVPEGVKPGIPHRIFAPDGHYMLLTTYSGRPTSKQNPEQQPGTPRRMQNYGNAAQYGTYKTEGDKVTLKVVETLNPGHIGAQFVWTFRMEGEDLITISTRNGQKTEGRWRRVK